MAAGLLKQALIKAEQTGYFINSAGLIALVGRQADPIACQLLYERGVDISDHRACQINREMIRKADLILVMEFNQKIAIEKNEPTSRGKVFLLGEWGKFDVMDPYQQDITVFERSLAQIEKGIFQWLSKLSIQSLKSKSDPL